MKMNPETFGEAILPLRPYLLRVARRFVGQEDAEDVVQEASLLAWKGIAMFREDSSLETWMVKITVNQARNHLRSLRSSRPLNRTQSLFNHDDDGTELIGRYPSAAPGPQECLLRQEIAVALEAALRSLPAQRRVLMKAFHEDELTYREIAEVSGLPMGTIKSALCRSREHLKADPRISSLMRTGRRYGPAILGAVDRPMEKDVAGKGPDDCDAAPARRLSSPNRAAGQEVPLRRLAP